MKPPMTTEIAEPQPNYLLSVLCVLRVLAVKALSGINREDAKSAKNPRRRIFSKRQRICTLSSTDEHGSAVPFICVHRCSSVVHFALFTARRITPVPGSNRRAAGGGRGVRQPPGARTAGLRGR